MAFGSALGNFASIFGGMAGLLTVAGFVYRWLIVPATQAWHSRKLADEQRAHEQTMALIDDRLEVKIAPIRDEVAAIRAEVQTNSGKSLKDHVLRLGHEVAAVDRRLDRIEQSGVRVEASSARIEEAAKPAGEQP